MSILDKKPPMMGSEICKIYYDDNKDECNPSCPFYIECLPFIKELAEELEKAYKEAGNAWWGEELKLEKGNEMKRDG